MFVSGFFSSSISIEFLDMMYIEIYALGFLLYSFHVKVTLKDQERRVSSINREDLHMKVTSVVSMNIFVALLSACIIIGHLLEENRWINESITALLIVRFLFVFIVAIDIEKMSFQKKFRFSLAGSLYWSLYTAIYWRKKLIYQYSVKIFSSFTFSHPSFSMPGQFTTLFYIFIQLFVTCSTA